MFESVDKFGKTVDIAIEEALKELGAAKEECTIEILQQPNKGFLGVIGNRSAYVRVTRDKELPKAKDPIVAKEIPAAPKMEKEEKSVPEETPEKAKKNPNFDPEKIAKDFLAEMFEAMEMDVEVTTELGEKQLKVELTGDSMGLLIGKRGQTLDAVQYLVNLVVNKENDGYLSVTLDTENYRERRKDTLEALARNLAKKAKATGRNVVLEPMNPYERRIIHSALQNDNQVTTYSEGEEPYRYIVIALKK